MLSKSCIYALRAIVFIAHNTTLEDRVGGKAIAKALEIPTPYLGKILQQLTKNHIIQSAKGPKGGFYLNEEAQKIKLINIIEIMDGLHFFTSCGFGLSTCVDEHPCPLHKEFMVYRDGLFDLFSAKSISDLVAKIEGGNAFIRNIPTA